jgi:glucose 1-dehydrogenase
MDASTRILAGQKALVTGANSGIGEAVAIALGEGGADVVVNYVAGEDRGEAVADEIRRSGVRAFVHPFFGDIRLVVPARNRRARHHRHPPQQCRAAAGRAVPRHDLGRVEHGDRRQSHGPVPLRTREAVPEFLRRGVVPGVSRAAGKIICISSWLDPTSRELLD